MQFGRKGIYTIPGEGGEAALITNDDGWETVEFAQASPGRDYVVYVDRKDGAYRINEIKLEGGTPRAIISFKGTSDHPTGLAESYDGSRVAYATPYPVNYIENLFFVNVADGKSLQITNFRVYDLKDPTWSPDGKKLAIRMAEGLFLVELKI